MLTQKQLSVKIAGIAKSAKSLRDNIQIVLTSAAAWAYVHGDVTAYDKLFAATSGVNRKKMVKWISEHGFARLDASGSFKVNKAARKEADFADGVEVVKYLTDHVPAWYVGEESAKQLARDADIQQLVAALLKRLDDTEEKGAKVINKDPNATAQIIDMLAERARRAA